MADIAHRHFFSTTPESNAQGISSGGGGGRVSPSTRRRLERLPSSPERTFFIKAEGDPDLAKLKTRTEDVADLKEEIIMKLPRLKLFNPSAITLHVAKDKDCNDLGDALDATDSLTDALHGAMAIKGIIRIVVKVADEGCSAAVIAAVGA